MTNIIVVVGAQYGSEGKGAITAHLSKRLTPRDTVIRVAGPNAGHTAYDSQGREWKLRCIPVAAVANTSCQLHIAAGSEVDPEVLMEEIVTLETAGIDVRRRLTIHPSATMLLGEHKYREGEAKLTERVGSTGKGIGAARADRIMRTALTFGQWSEENLELINVLGEEGPFDLDGAGSIIVEGTQGYGLGLHTQHYPQVTSSDCRNIDFLAMSGIPVFDTRVTRIKTILVARVYPIRVAGNSGPMLGETSWRELGLPEERTTVTHKIRRVGQWDEGLVLEALHANGGRDFNPDVTVALTMLDQKMPELRDQTKLTEAAEEYVDTLENQLETYIEYVGTGPQTVVER